jgi:hypothetical protein
MLPNVNWQNLLNVAITIKHGGSGGSGSIIGHWHFMSNSFKEVCNIAKMYILNGKRVYIPTNQVRIVRHLQAFCLHLGLRPAQIVALSSESSMELKGDMITIPAQCLEGVQVFIASPTFGFGFNVPGGLFDITIAMFFVFPVIVRSNVQHVARVRGNIEETIIYFYQRSAGRYTYKKGEAAL